MAFLVLPGGALPAYTGSTVDSYKPGALCIGATEQMWGFRPPPGLCTEANSVQIVRNQGVAVRSGARFVSERFLFSSESER